MVVPEDHRSLADRAAAVHRVGVVGQSGDLHPSLESEDPEAVDRGDPQTARLRFPIRVVHRVLEDRPDIEHMCAACFSGEYPTGDITPEMLLQIEEERTLQGK